MTLPNVFYFVDCPLCRQRWNGRCDVGVWEYEGGEGLSYTLTPEAQTCPYCTFRLRPGCRFTIMAPDGHTTTYAIPPCGCGDRTALVTTVPSHDGSRHLPTCPYASMREVT